MEGILMVNKVKEKWTRWTSVLQMILALGWIEVNTMMPAFADVESTLKGVETGLGSNFRKFANPALGIAVLIYGGCRFLGLELSQWAKRFAFGAFLGAAIIINFSWIKDTIWGWLGG
ncbi:hypothetical protein KUB3006_P20140 (plasmid) [Enterococcus faecalis]|nr:hypothetical protein KUB3006_P20140 [Enterococcus faecalis]BBD29495.1 hypothetical protein KUB3007_P20140 [Enterococcus faecalis]